MNWPQLRSAFIRERKRRRLTQQNVADAAELDQSSISKLESNDTLGPAAEVFIRAVEGLGMPVSVFFATIEQRHETGSTPAGGSPRDRSIQPGASALPEVQAAALSELQAGISRLLTRYGRALAGEQAPAARTPRPRRRKDGDELR